MPLAQEAFWMSIEEGWSRVNASQIAEHKQELVARITKAPSVEAAAARESNTKPPLFDVAPLRWALINHGTGRDERHSAAFLLGSLERSLAVELTTMLRQLPRKRVEQWDEIFWEYIKRLNQPRLSRHINEASDDWFLYGRCVVVGAGRDYYNAFCKAPYKYSPGGGACENMLYVTHPILYPEDDPDECLPEKVLSRPESQADKATSPAAPVDAVNATSNNKEVDK
jgi:hypothetical protein